MPISGYKKITVPIQTKDDLKKLADKHHTSQLGIVSWFVDAVTSNKIDMKKHWAEIQRLYPTNKEGRELRWKELSNRLLGLLSDPELEPLTPQQLSEFTGYTVNQIETFLRNNKGLLSRRPGGKYRAKK